MKEMVKQKSQEKSENVKEKEIILLEESDLETVSDKESNEMLTSTSAKRIVEEKANIKKNRNSLKVVVEKTKSNKVVTPTSPEVSEMEESEEEDGRGEKRKEKVTEKKKNPRKG